MPVLESTDKLAPKSVLRHRPLGDGKLVTTTPIVQRASRPRPADVVDDEVVEWKRQPEQADTQQVQAQAGKRGTATTAPKKLPRTSQPKARTFTLTQAHPLLYLGLGMIAMLLLWTILSAVFAWVTITLDDLHYGRPRTFQMDAVVGHGDSPSNPSHFIALNLNRHIEIIEISGGDPSHTHLYSGPQLYGANDDLVPVTVKFVDVNGDHKPDMIITFAESRLVYINDGTSFRPLLPSERSSVEQFLQQTRP
jgi:hypothetical protein